MRKLLTTITLGLLAVACGGGGPTAATVNGEEIDVGEVESLMETSGQTAGKDAFAQFLTYQIQWHIVFAAAAEDYGLTFSEEEITAEADRIFEEFAQGQTREEFLSARGITEEFLRNIAHQGLIDVGIREQLLDDVAEPTAEEIEIARGEAEATLTNACVSHILVATEDEALDVLERLDAGEVFGEVAAEVSTDTNSAANNGILPCGSPAGYVPPFRDAVMTAPVGEVLPEPVESEFGFHVIKVTDRQLPAEDQLPTEEELSDGVRDEAVLAALEEWFLGAIADAEVVVEEEYGSWQANPPTVVPPTD